MEEMAFRELTRREFFKKGCQIGIGLGVSSLVLDPLFRSATLASIGETRGLREAMYYQMIDEKTVMCLLCPRNCVLSEGERSDCRVKELKDGKFYTLVYGLACAAHIDPIEKKPVFHMLPGSQAFSIATAGCNLRCKYCQNWEISQRSPEETINFKLMPQQVVEMALERNCRSIAYTYTEPTIFYEYMIDTAKLAKKKGIKNIYVTDTYINPEPLKELCKYIDACNADLKGFTNKFLIPICAAKLEPVLEALKIMHENGVWLEITNLIVPTLNDDMETIKKMCIWIKSNLGPDVPLHFSRFWPKYKLKHLPPTPVSTLEEARNTALKLGLHYVYIGNVPGHEGNNTYCPKCGKMLIHRMGFTIFQNNIQNGKCKFCGHEIPGVWKASH